ncbi:MAG: hypothetical protein QXJ02_02290 [Candidatus Bathyarchaeia archaeon]
MIKFRIDVDYPYPSRIKSFIYVFLGIKKSKDYLKNSKIIAKMMNETRKKVKAYWFFTIKTLPDEELLSLLNNNVHEIALHVVNNPNEELRKAEEVTGRKINYYTIHGTERLFGRIIWGRWRRKVPKIPETFPLKSFHELPTIGLDRLCYFHSAEEAQKIAEDKIRKGYVVYFHPIWLFQRGTLNHRGPFYEALRRILSD